MTNPPAFRPSLPRQQSRVPGGFDTDDDLSPIKTNFDYHVSDGAQEQTQSDELEAVDDNNTFGYANSEEGHSRLTGNDSTMDEKEMKKQLMDVESSFMAEASPVGQKIHDGPDDTFVFGSPAHRKNTENEASRSSATPSELYQTPAPGREQEFSPPRNQHELNPLQANTSSLETMSSSPTAAAAARTVPRAISMASLGGYETAEEESPAKEASDDGTPPTTGDLTPKLSNLQIRDSSSAGSPTPTRSVPQKEIEDADHGDIDESEAVTLHGPRKRPKFLNNRYASQRSSYSSYTSQRTTSTEGVSEVTIGAEYALQTGGAIPFTGSGASKTAPDLLRSISLGSMASGISELSDGDDRMRPGNKIADNLDPLAEEDISLLVENLARGRDQDPTAPQTPRATSRNKSIASDFPNTDQLSRNNNSSPDRRNGLSAPATGRSKNMTLKEQSNTIDRLQKENFSLKLKIQFMNNNLDQHSDESVKAMTSENVELRMYKVNSAREIRNQKRLVRELEHKLKECQERLAARAELLKRGDNVALPHREGIHELEAEIAFLREHVETFEIEIDKLRSEGVAKDGERRRLAELIKDMGERRAGGNDIGIREEVDMWRDLLENETARREQADEENQRLRDELRRFKADAASTISHNYSSSSHHTNNQRHVSSDAARMNGSRYDIKRSGVASSSSVTMVEQLRHENAELRREVGAQTSMLTSRNREKERLYQEIEDLKMGQRRGEGPRSIASESIFERSASRAHGRSISRVSNITRNTQLSDAERETYEVQIGELRDQISELRLQIQDLVAQCDDLRYKNDQNSTLEADFQKLEGMYDDLTDQTTQDLLSMQRERDEALELYEDAEASFRDVKEEAQSRIDALEEELDQKVELLERAEKDLISRDEESEALRNEVRMMSEGLERVEADVQAKIRRIQEVGLENEDITRELEGVEKSLLEANGKNKKLAIELESRQGECAFLREEQDGCMLKIGDLETAIKAAHTNLSSERDRASELEQRLADERHQQEVIGGKEKQEVQKIMNELNRDATNSKDEARKLKKILEVRETELTMSKDRLTELEVSLQEILGDPTGSKASFLASISKLQQDLKSFSSQLDATRQALSDKERLIQKRDALLESHGLESRKLSELLDKERSGRRADKAQHEQWQKSHQHTSRTVSQKEGRIAELEAGRQADRKKATALEHQLKDQLLERNNLLLGLWHRLSIMCGQDWQHQNCLVSGHLPTVEVVASMLAEFSKNLLLAVKMLETLTGSFRTRIRGIERDFTKDFQALEHNLDMRIKRLDRLESAVQVSRVAGAASAAPEIAKLRGENRLLKAELQILQKHEMHGRVSSRADGRAGNGSGDRTASTGSRTTLMRHHSSSEIEGVVDRRGSTGHTETAEAVVASMPLVQSQAAEPSQQRWIHRLRELERRLKAEREARLLDRSGARKRLEERQAENEELRQELERERVRAGG